MSRIHKTGERRGFTLVEILLVVCILVVIAGMALPSIGRLVPSLTLKQTAENLADTMRLAQTKALAYRKSLRLVFDQTFSSFHIEEATSTTNDDEAKYEPLAGRLGKSQSLPDNIVITAPDSLLFSADGQMEKENIVLCLKGEKSCYTISTKVQYGQIRVFNFKLES